jgi:hypothetical protein
MQDGHYPLIWLSDCRADDPLDLFAVQVERGDGTPR